MEQCRPFYTVSLRTAAALCFFLLSGCASLDFFSDKAPPAPVEEIIVTAPAEPPESDIFRRIRSGFSIPDIDDNLVLRHREAYLVNSSNFRRMIERGRPYLYHIVEEIEKRGLPTELALLPIVESAYNPMAYSRAKASGLWQFIPSTGKYYNLTQTWWQDERRDILASTTAALDYFEALYEKHGDWHLALASYNWGSGSVGKAIVKNQKQGLPADYLSLTSMPDETRNYVPKLQALENIVRDPELFASLNITAIPDRPYFAAVDSTLNADVKLLAQLAEISEEEFLALNPAHNRPVVVSKSMLLLPESQVGIFEKNIKDHIDGGKLLSSWQLYTIRQDEQLEDIAKRFGMTLASLTQINDIGARFEPRPGLSLLVSGNRGGEPLNEKTLSRSLRFPESERDTGFVAGRFYTIRKGDTLQLIARLTGVSVDAIRRRNGLRGERIIAGKQLIVPRSGVSYAARPSIRTSPPALSGALPDVSNTTSYTIRSGDTLTSIARQFHVAVDDLMRWNPVSPQKLQPGKTLRILLARTP
ncbi:MAG: LysM peptidoglycan-binding domain-containing protein [Candidatus Accumulibacter sp.]|jgi:membrane-bound lytic murein transglycosylase D|nr:LysM peptidoglycan-binding domain-containing protein [Accumulibacter sp.]